MSRDADIDQDVFIIAEKARKCEDAALCVSVRGKAAMFIEMSSTYPD